MDSIDSIWKYKWLVICTAALPAGTYSAEVVINYEVGSVANELVIPFSYIVDPVSLVAPVNVDFSINLNSTASETQQVIEISSNTTQNLSWHASSGADWLKVYPDTGDTETQNQLTLSLDLNALRTMENGTYISTVTLSSDQPNVLDSSISVQLFFEVASINYVSPYVLYENLAHQVTLKGSNLLQAAGLTMEVGSATISNFTVVDDSEITIDIPELPAGEYRFQLVDNLGIAPATGRLLIRTAPQYHETVTSLQGRPESIEYDPERDAFYVVLSDRTGRFAQRIGYDGAQWVATNLNVENPLAVGLSADGSELLLTTSNCEVAHLDSDTLDVISLNTYQGSCYIMRFGILNSFDDGQILIANNNQWSDMWEYPGFARFPAPSVHNPISIRSRYRNAMLWAEGPLSGTSRPLYIYSSKADTFTQFSIHDSDSSYLPYNLAINDDGSRLLHKFDVYDENQSYIGSLSGQTYDIRDGIGITPDGSRAIRFSYDTKKLSVFDLSMNTGPFLQLGNDIVLADDTFDRVIKIESSPDGSVVFVFGQNIGAQSVAEYKLSVTPLP
ncbi:MAG: hypothetical protein P8171_19430 [Candidatus Thiodiazotropha sp.]